jgi:tRNA(Ile)-lysidine synthase
VAPRDPDPTDDIAALRASLHLVDHAVAAAIGRVRARAQPAARQLGRRWLVACSGGADSLVLLCLLASLRRGLDVSLATAHVDHGLRPDAAHEGERVRRVALALDVPFHALRISLAPGGSLATRARQARHAVLDDCAAAWGADAIALGHTATDRAETLLLNLARGSGLAGLTAMPVSDPRRVRPLIDFSRAEVRALAVRMRLPFVDDPTNEREDLPRTAVRHRVLPVLDTLHAGADRRIAATAGDLEDLAAALEEWCRRELAARARRADDVDVDAALVVAAVAAPPVTPGVTEAAPDSTAGEVLAGDALASRAHPLAMNADQAVDAPPAGRVGMALQLARWSTVPRAVRTRVLRAFLLERGVDGSSLTRDVVSDIDAACTDASTHRGGRLRRWAVRPAREVHVLRGTGIVPSGAAADAD